MSTSFILSTFGVIVTVLGGLCLAFELAVPFTGKAYGGIDASNADGFAHPTEEYKAWEAKKRRWSFIGIALVLFGSAVQIVGARLGDTGFQSSVRPTEAKPK